MPANCASQFHGRATLNLEMPEQSIRNRFSIEGWMIKNICIYSIVILISYISQTFQKIFGDQSHPGPHH